MTTRKQPRLFAAMIALGLLSMGMSGSVWARGDSDGAAGRGGFLGGVLQELVFPCQAACRNAAEDCIEPLKADAVTCVQDACATQVQAAQTACAADRTAQACRDAVRAVRTCGESCLTTLQTGVAACRDTDQSCRDACDTE